MEIAVGGVHKAEVCVGCGACANICPKNALTMQQDKEGFFYPVVKRGACVQCGICLKTCPVQAKRLIKQIKRR